MCPHARVFWGAPCTSETSLGASKCNENSAAEAWEFVYVAVDATLGREVALKVLPASDDVERRRRFMREARSAASVTHPGIATVYDVGEQDGAVFIAMELVRGKTLRTWLDEHRIIPIVEAQRIGRAIARTLAKAHELGVVHRDLKPENAMLTDDGDVKLLDFGLAKLVGPSLSGSGPTTETQEGRIMGTPCYMSPEQARGLAVDARSDVFSFGVMFYELLTGRRPFCGATSVDLLASITRDEPVAVNEVDAEISEGVARVVTRCLRKVSTDRYADAGALAADLEDACAATTDKPLAHQESTLDPKESAKPKRESRLSRRIMGTAIGLSLVAAISGASWYLWSVADVKSGALAKPAASIASSAMTLDVTSAAKSPRAEALELYRKALAEFRKGSGSPWFSMLMHAVELDPTLAEAHVRIAAALLYHVNADVTREHYRKAMDLSGTLQEKDRVLLDAIEPLILQQPSDWAESIRRFSKAVEKFPNDAHFWFYLAMVTANFEDFGKSNEYLVRAIDLDPGFGNARSSLALNVAYEGRFGSGRRSGRAMFESRS